MGFPGGHFILFSQDIEAEQGAHTPPLLFPLLVLIFSPSDLPSSAMMVELALEL